MTYYN